MAKKSGLSAYKKKRDFRKTGEPKGKSKKSNSGRIFVIQKHDASSRHYDFRIEIDGVMKSWAVPKGPSTNPREKRLAIETEDHPIDYSDFEGVIPEGQYGAGTVMVWDTGTYENIKKDNGRKKAMSRCYDDGQIEIKLDGEKISGGYALVNTKRGKNNQWLLIKMKDNHADARRKPTKSQNKSVKTSRTMKQIEKEESD